MKKSFKLVASVLAILSLSACESLGEPLEYREGLKQQAHYEAQAKDHLKNVYGYNNKLTLKMSSGSTTMTSTSTAQVHYDLSAVYYHSKAKATVSMSGESASATQEEYIYYKDGVLIDALQSATGTKTYSSVKMSQSEAKEYLLDNYITKSSDLSSLTEGTISSVDTTNETSLEKYYLSVYEKDECKFYSKGEGNLTCKVKMNVRGKSGNTTLNFAIKMTGVFNDYVMTKVSMDATATYSGVKITLKLSSNGSESWKTTYPNLSGYARSLN